MISFMAACSGGDDDPGNPECSQTKVCPIGFMCTADGRCVAVAGTPDAASGLDARPGVDAGRSVDAPLALLDAPVSVADSALPPPPDAAVPQVDAPPPDTTAPVVTLTGTPLEGQFLASATTNLAWAFAPAEPASSQLECAVDGGDYATGNCKNGPYADGAHTFAVRGRDAAGNVSATKMVTFIVDTVAPSATIVSSDPANGAVTKDASWDVTFSSNETSVFYDCLLDGTMQIRPCGGTFGGLFDGVKTLQVRAVDRAGNVGAYSAQIAYTLDTQGPNLTNISKPFTHDNPRQATVSWSADEPATYTCTYMRVDNPVDCANGSWTGMEVRSTNYLDVTATDGLGNVSTTSISWTVN